MSIIRANTLQNTAGSKSVPVDTVVDGSAKAWVNFNGTGTVAIRAAFNVSSITDNGVGRYVVNFSTAIADANYSAVAIAGQGNGFSADVIAPGAAVPTTTQFSIDTLNGGQASYIDAPFVSLAIFR